MENSIFSRFLGKNPKIHYFMSSLILLNVLIIIAAGILTPLWGDFVRYLGGDVRVAGKAICVFSIVIGIFTCIAARIEHEVRQDELFMLFSSTFITISYAGYFFVSVPWELYAVEALLGFGCAFQVPALYALYQRYMPAHRSALDWGIWTGMYHISIGISALMSAYVMHRYGFKAVFSALFCIAVIGLILTYVVIFKIYQFKSKVAKNN